MNDEFLESLVEMRERVKKDFGDEYGSDAELFVNEFLNGEYHEHETDWAAIANSLSKKQLCHEALTVIHALIAGSAEAREGAQLKTIMRFYNALRLWSLCQLESQEDFSESVDAMKKLVTHFARAHNEYGGWNETVRAFSLVHLGILAHTGLNCSPLKMEYDEVIRGLCSGHPKAAAKL